MKKILTLAMFAVLAGTCNAQINLNGITDEIKNTIGKNSLSEEEVVKGLKEALTVGTNNSVTTASKFDGFFKNPAIKIPFPKEAQEMERTLRSLGMDKQVNQFVMTLNRAAENAAKDAAPIFIEAIKNISITDAFNILKGADDAATVFLKNATTAQLKEKFRPVIKNSLQKVAITKYWKPLANKYNKLPMVKKINPNLEEYVTGKVIQGIFHLIAEEEKKIRKDPLARVSDILKKVFGN